MIDTVEERPGPETCAYAGELGSVLEAAIGRLPRRASGSSSSCGITKG